MKYFYKRTDFKFLDKLLSLEFVNTVSAEYDLYLQTMPKIQQTKLKLIKESKLIRYFLLFIKYEFGKVATPFFELFNIHCSDFNKNDGPNGTRTANRGVEGEQRDVLIETINNMFDNEPKLNCFTNTLTTIDSLPLQSSVCGFLHFLPNAVIKRHRHDPGHSVLHVLLEDIPDGKLYVTVGDETLPLSRKGDFVMFDQYDYHECKLEGNQECKLFSFGINKGTYEQH